MAASPSLAVSTLASLRGTGPGLALCGLTAAGAIGLAELERAVFGHAWLEPLVLAILLGASVRTVWTPGAIWRSGVNFGARTLLEIAIVLLGASVSAGVLANLGLPLILSVLLLVAAALGVGFLIGRALGLNPKLALLVASGNAICGNSAIAAVAPVIEADGEDVISAIAFTAVLGVIVVLALPVLAGLLKLSAIQAGALAGLSVYAVPQVLAAAAPFGGTAVQTGTLVKLLRVLMLGPVIFAVTLLSGRERGAGRPGLHRMVPWFVAGFVVMIALRTLGLIPAALLPGLDWTADLLTIAALAALGLQTDIRAVARSGGRVIAAAVLSLLVLLAMALVLIGLLGL